MKKYYTVIFALMMAFSVTACGSSESETTEENQGDESAVLEGSVNNDSEIYIVELDGQFSDIDKEEETTNVENTKVDYDEVNSLENIDTNDEDTKTSVTLTESSSQVSETEVHKHNYIAKSVIAASCTLEGTVLYTCECGANYTESLSVQGHDYAGGATCVRCGASNPDYVPVHVHEWKHETRYTLDHTNEGHYAPYICECRLDFQSYEELEAHQEETAIKSRESYRDENGVWHGDIAHGGWCNGWIVEREWDIKATSSRDICSCGEIANEQRIVEEVDCTCVHYGPDMHFHFADRDCCNTDWK